MFVCSNTRKLFEHLGGQYMINKFQPKTNTLLYIYMLYIHMLYMFYLFRYVCIYCFEPRRLFALLFREK